MTYTGPIVDTDVHHDWPTDAAILPYLPKKWRDFITLPEGRLIPLKPAAIYYPTPDGVYRMETYPPEGKPGSSYELMRDQLLDPLNVECAILGYDVGQAAGLPNIYLASALVSAMNDWTIDQWLGRDRRLKASLLVQTQSPDDAVREIERLGRHPGIVSVLLVMLGMSRPFGHPAYHPIYETAAEIGLPVNIHIAGTTALPGAQSVGGHLGNRFERHTLHTQPTEHHLTSLITHGVFEKYPALRVMLIETGISWIPWLLYEMDRNVAGLRAESPWVKRLPSEYFREHIRVTTQPLDVGPRKSDLIKVLETFPGIEDVLCFATDYPHWDTDTKEFVAARLPEHWANRVFYQNAASFYQLAPPVPASLAT